MDKVIKLGGAAPGQFKEKIIGGMIGGIKVGSQVVKPLRDGAGLLMIGEVDSRLKKLDEQGRVMEKSWMNSLGFIDLIVHGKTIQALVDTGATHNFMTTRLAKEAGLMISPSDMEVKVVNSRAKVAGLVHDVPVQMKEWKGQLDFIVMEMNDFDVILGQDFLKSNKTIVVPFCDEEKLLQLG